MNFPIVDFPQMWDSTMVAELGCGFKTWLAFFHHYKSKHPAVHLVAGGAFARGLEVAKREFYDSGLAPEKAIALGSAALIETYGDFNPGKETKSCNRMVGALDYYFIRYPLGKDKAVPLKGADGRSEVEWSFCLPLPINHPVSGESLLYTGRMDGVCDYLGADYGKDEKTTGQLGPTWPNQWNLRSQFTGYSWARREVGRPIAGILVRGIAIYKNGYDIDEAIEPRANWEIDRWLEQTVRKLEVAVKWWTEFNTFGVLPPMALDEKCNNYGGCQFKIVCRSQDPEPWLKTNFERRVWNPLLREEKILEKAAT